MGAGFSVGAVSTKGDRLPSSQELAEAFFAVAFPGRPVDMETHLGDAFHAARANNQKELRRVVAERLTIDAERLPEYYRIWFSLPWLRCYSLNLDELELAAARRFSLPRPIRTISATSGLVSGSDDPYALEVVHLNGTVSDDLSHVTFSDLDYAKRQTGPDKWLVECSVDILSRPVVFVGTLLNEPTLWQYVEYRRTKGPTGTKEFRPGSYLVTPRLNPAREVVLKELNVDHVPMNAEEFAAQVLEAVPDAASEGLKVLDARHASESRARHPRTVAELIGGLRDSPSDYLLGQEPSWADLTSGRAIHRAADDRVIESAEVILAGEQVPLIITGTAGSGKSTALMRLALWVNAQGHATYWVDERSNFEPHRLRELVHGTDGPLAILIDDSDLWGRIAAGWARELPLLRKHVLLAAAVRSTKVDGLFDKTTLADVEPLEVSMPHLEDAEIEQLIAVLDRENRLGVLKGKTPTERHAAFRNEAGRQLLVAMIQATSGKTLREKAFDEYRELADDQRTIYAMICLVSSQRYTLDREEILLALGSSTNEVLNAIERLVQRHIVVREDVHTGYSARHRVIADEVVGGMQNRLAVVGPALEGISFAFATRVSPQLPRTNRLWRRLIRFMNHEFLIRMSSLDSGRAVYARLEDVMTWDWHYWLQRGSLEVELGDLDRATHFLDQARSLAAGERMLETEYGYLLLKKAARDPSAPAANEWFEEGNQTLEELIRTHGRADAYPYHVLGSQGLAWAKAARMGQLERRAYLRHLLDLLEEGMDRHPTADELNLIARDIKAEWLRTAVAPDA